MIQTRREQLYCVHSIEGQKGDGRRKPHTKHSSPAPANLIPRPHTCPIHSPPLSASDTLAPKHTARHLRPASMGSFKAQRFSISSYFALLLRSKRKGSTPQRQTTPNRCPPTAIWALTIHCAESVARRTMSPSMPTQLPSWVPKKGNAALRCTRGVWQPWPKRTQKKREGCCVCVR